MIERRGLLWDGFKARYYDVQLPDPVKNGNDFEPIVLTDELLAEWDKKATEIVDCEAINDAEMIGDRLYGAEELRLSILRVRHQDGTVTIEPVYKLFPVGERKHCLMRNTLLCYRDVEGWVKSAIESDAFFAQRGFESKTPPFLDILKMMYCRKYDINMYQAARRTAGMDSARWDKELGGKYDRDFCWVWCP